GLYGWVEFVQLCRSYHLRPLCGADLQAEDASAVLLAKDPKGYERICRIISDGHLENHFNLTKTLLEYRSNLAVLTRNLGFLETLARESGLEDLYTEIVPGEENHPRLAFSRRMGIPPVATNDVYFSDPAEFPIHQMLRAIDLNTCLSRLPKSDCV